MAKSHTRGRQGTANRASLGCGLCAHVCPRGVLRLENVTRRHPQELVLVEIPDAPRNVKAAT